MTLFFAMLPIYIFGNLHCFGMCGPLAMMIGRHRYRHWYFAGRIASFGLAGLAAGELGQVLTVLLQRNHLSAGVSFIFGTMIFITGVFTLAGIQLNAQIFSSWNKSISILMLKDQIWPTFLFGFFTVFLPCGQTMVVFSACALSQHALVGFFNGLGFALITSPSLFFAMQAQAFFQTSKKFGNLILGGCALLIGILSLCRGFAEMEIIPHLVLNSKAKMEYHIVIY